MDNTSMTTKDALLALDHARPAHLPPSASPALLLDMLQIKMESVLPSVAMDSSLELKNVILETATVQDASTAKFNKDTPALDNLPSAEHQDLQPPNHQPHSHLPHNHLPLLLHQPPLQLTQLSTSQETATSTPTTSSSP